MEKFSVKRGLVKQIGGNAGLAKLATQYFDDVNANSDGEFTASYGILTKVTGYFDKDGKLVVDVEQLKGDELNDFLAAEGGRQQAMESRKRWSGFLDQATGYNAKQRGDKAKEEAKKFSKAKSAIKMAHKSMEMATKLTDETKNKALEMIAELESMIDNGEAPSEGKVKKLNDLF
tara:strand:- start:62 stop:586 length:525 start_codon:yes stop_codon:yes gene_type:complete